MLPESVRALRDRAPGWYYAALEQALDSEPEQFASRLRALTGVPSLREAGVNEESLERCVEEASRRPELQMTPPPADAEEIRGLYAAAY
jgi:alcohol dehydrogenase class IV